MISIDRIRNRLCRSLAGVENPYLAAALYRLRGRLSVPSLQDAPILLLTMGRVGSISTEDGLRTSGFNFSHLIHNLKSRRTQYPHYPARFIRMSRRGDLIRRHGIPWVLRQPKVRFITMVRDPIARLLSIYLFGYPMLFGESLRAADLPTILARFPILFEKEYLFRLLPGEFFEEEFSKGLGMDVNQAKVASSGGWGTVTQGSFSTLVLKLETPDAVKSNALSQ